MATHYIKAAVVMAAALMAIGMTLPIKPTIVIHAQPMHCQLPDTFSLKWRHSVEKQYWQEVYQLHYPDLILTKTYLQTFGAGTPNLGEPTRAPDGYLGQLVNLPMDELNWLVSHNMQGEIVMGDAVEAHSAIMPIHQMVEDRSVVNVRPEKLTVWQYITLPRCKAMMNGKNG